MQSWGNKFPTKLCSYSFNKCLYKIQLAIYYSILQLNYIPIITIKVKNIVTNWISSSLTFAVRFMLEYLVDNSYYLRYDFHSLYVIIMSGEEQNIYLINKILLTTFSYGCCGINNHVLYSNHKLMLLNTFVKINYVN